MPCFVMLSFPYGRANSTQPKTCLIADSVVAGGLCAWPLIAWECFQSIRSRCEGAAAVTVTVCGGGQENGSRAWFEKTKTIKTQTKI